MPLFHLVPHPDKPPHLVNSVTVTIERTGQHGVWLYFDVLGAASLLIPSSQPPVRSDGLWRTTCFELFVNTAGNDAYTEFNFSPSGQWAAYAFDAYRSGMRELATEPPDIDVGPTGRRRFYLGAETRVPPAVPAEGMLALSAVLEEEGGITSYWALAHPPGAPDFHHPACFAARLPAPERA